MNRTVLVLGLSVGIPVAVIAFWFSYHPSKIDRSNRPDYICMNNLRNIDAAKQAWALEHNRTNGSITWNDVLPYLGRQGTDTPIPRCPGGGTYTLRNIEEQPICSVPGHVLPQFMNSATAAR